MDEARVVLREPGLPRGEDDDLPRRGAAIEHVAGDAQRRLISAGLVPSLGEERFSGDAPKSTVLAQTPPAGESVLLAALMLLGR